MKKVRGARHDYKPLAMLRKYKMQHAEPPSVESINAPADLDLNRSVLMTGQGPREKLAQMQTSKKDHDTLEAIQR